MPRVFLSRKLKPASPFHQLRSEEGWILEAQSLLQFTPVKVKEVPVASWLFFYSAKGVEMFLQQQSPRKDQLLACLGASASRSLSEHGFSSDYCGNGDPLAVAKEFQKIIQQESVVFVQARKSRASVEKLLDESTSCQALIVYDNQPLKDFELGRADYLIFTSPLNFEAYMKCYPIQPTQRLIGIGNTTAVTFSEAAVKEYRIAHQPSEASLLECLREWEQEYPLRNVE